MLAAVLVAEIVQIQKMPTQEEIETTCADAICSYKRYERRRIILLFGGLAALLAVVIIIQYLALHLG